MSKQSKTEYYLSDLETQYSELNMITIQDYAARNGVPYQNVMLDVVKGKYANVVLLINANEKCVTSISAKQEKLPEGYVTPKEYSKLHHKSYGVLLRDIKTGKYKTAFQDSSNRWYLKADDMIDNGYSGYVTAKQYAEYHNLSINILMRDIKAGYYKSAIQDNTRHWRMLLSEKKEVDYSIDLSNYMPMKAYAEKHNLKYNTLAEDVRAGNYGKYIERVGHLVYIRKDAPCITGEKGTQPYLLLRKYADKNQVDYQILRSDVIDGKYHTAKKINGRWYINPHEKCISYKGMYQYTSARKYAEEHSISYTKLLNDIKMGVYSTAVFDRGVWLLQKDETCKTNRNNGAFAPHRDGLLSAAEYAKAHNLTRQKVVSEIKAGTFTTAELINNRWYISEDEIVEILEEDFITLSAYAKIYKMSRSKLLSDVEAGVYDTAKKFKGGWVINKNEPLRSVDKRKKENKQQEFITVRQYAIDHNIPYLKMLNEVKAGVYHTARCEGKRWYIDKTERCKTKVRPYRKKLKE